MSDFSDRPFVAGTLTGLRAFDVDKLGRLVGPTYPLVFTPGENVGTCYRGEGLRVQAWQLDALTAQLRHRPVPTRPALTPSKAGHQVGKEGCGCGFYAYFDGQNDLMKPNRVAAVIEGYGVCTVGSRGFRAEKAKVVGLVLPKEVRGFRVGSHRVSYWWSLFGLLELALAPVSAFDGRWLSFGLHLLTAAFCVLNIAIGWRRSKVDPRFQLVRRNYPDVKVYSTKRAALKAHPLTQPALPTPTTVDDFWTVSA